jgi:hypothetical protein
MLYHGTRDPVLVKEFLGHRRLGTTLLYVQLEKALFKAGDDEFIVKATEDAEKLRCCLSLALSTFANKTV